MLINNNTDYDLHIVETGEDALEKLKSFTPNLILLDINLPGMDGYSVFKHIRKEHTLDNTPVLALTANAMETDKKQAESAGFDGYLTKPINVRNFIDTINKVLLVD